MLLKCIYKKPVLVFLLISVIAFSSFAQKDYKLKKVSVLGNVVIKDIEIKANMNTKAKTTLGRLEFWKKSPRFSNLTFDDDIRRLNSVYQRNGFLAPTIDHVFTKNDSAKTLRITLKINEGEFVSINKIGFQIIGKSDYHPTLDLTDKKLPIKEGDRFQDEKVKAYETYIAKKFSDRGYPFPIVKNDVNLLSGNKRADINYTIDPGEKCNFGVTWIRNDSLVPESFIRNRLKYKEGEPYSKDLIEKSQQRLYDTELFQYVVVRTLVDSVKNGSVPILIQMKEKPRWSLEAGVGYGSEDRFRVSAQVTRRQFFGGARKLIFNGKRSYSLPASYELSFVQPDFIKDNLDFIITPYFIWNNETSYDVKRLGNSWALKYNFTRNTSAYLMYSYETDRFNFKSDDAMNIADSDSLPYNKSLYTLGFSHNSTNDIFNPSDGSRFSTNVGFMGTFFDSKYHYIKLESEFRKYIALDDNFVFAFKVKFGGIKPIKGDQETPVEDRFMLGGALSLRGWGRNQISPVNNKGDFVGGNSMIESSIELRYPIFDIISGAVFFDSGNVWAEPFNYDLTDLRTDFGVGLRVSTPIGPVRFDYATPISEGKFKGVFFFSIGHAF